MTCPNCFCVFLLSLHPTDPKWGEPAKPDAEMTCPSCSIIGPAEDFGARSFPSWQAGVQWFLEQVSRQQSIKTMGSA